MEKPVMFECCRCNVDVPCTAFRRGILDNKTPTECPFNDTPEWYEVI